MPYVEPTKKRKGSASEKTRGQEEEKLGAIAATKAAPRPKKKKKRESPWSCSARKLPDPLRRAAAQAALNRGFADGMMASAHRGRDEVAKDRSCEKRVTRVNWRRPGPKCHLVLRRLDVTKK